MRSRLFRALRLAVGLGALAFLLSRIDYGAARETVGGAQAGWLVAAMGVQVVGKTCWLCRWRTLLVSAGHPRGFGSLLRWILLGLFFNNFLPTSVGGDVVRGYELSRSGVPLATAAASVVGDRVLGLLALGWLAVVGGVLGLVLWPQAGPWGAATGLAVALVAALTILRRPRVLDAVAGSRLLRGSAPLVGKLRRLVEATALLSGRGGAVRRALAFSLALAVCSALYHWSVGRAVGIPLPLAAYFVMVPAVMLFAALPLTLNGLGIREVGFVGFLAALGVPTDTGTVFALLAFVGTLVFAIAGGVLFLAAGAPVARNLEEETR